MPAGDPRPLAVVFGVSIYRRASWNLRTAASDAAALAAALERDHGYEVWLRRDAEVTRDALDALLGAPLREAMIGRRQLLVFFAGHGIAEDTIEDIAGYLVPHDGDEHRYPMHALIARLDALDAHHLLLVLDCCFAGAIHWARRRDLGGPPRMYRERYELYLASPAWQVLTSAAHDQRALDVCDGRALGQRELDATTPRSPFADALLAGLAGAADTFPRRADGTRGDGVVTATELYLHVHDALAFPAPGEVRADQTPGLWRMRPRDRGEYLFHHPTQPLALDDAPALTRETCPYRGVEPFEERHQALFFGRAAIRDALVAHVGARAVTIVIGASGTGKSSLVRAGLIPALRAADPALAIVGPFRPGRDPLGALDGALAATPAGRRCVVVDQLEEILTQRDGAPRAADDAPAHVRFLQRLAALAGDGATIVATLRADFEPALWSGPLHAIWDDARFAITDMTQDELREAIERPAEARVLVFDPPALVDRLVNAVVGMPGALPLLSFTLAHLYGEMVRRATGDRALRAADYDDVGDPGVPGGIPGALQRRAAAIRAALDDDGRLMLHAVALRMVTVAAGVATRRRVPLDELVFGRAADDAHRAAVLDALGAASDTRLVVAGSDGDVAYVEPAHDAVVHAWPDVQATLRDDAGIDTLLFHRRCTAATAEWLRAGRDPRLLWGEPRLGRALAELDRGPFLANADERAFLGASRDAERARTDAIEQDRRRRRRRAITIAAAVGLVLAGAALFSLDRARRAEASAARETRANLAAQRDAERATAAAIRADDRVRLQAARRVLDEDPTVAAAILQEVQRPDDAPGWPDLVRAALAHGVALVAVPTRAYDRPRLHGRTLAFSYTETRLRFPRAVRGGDRHAPRLARHRAGPGDRDDGRGAAALSRRDVRARVGRRRRARALRRHDRCAPRCARRVWTGGPVRVHERHDRGDVGRAHLPVGRRRRRGGRGPARRRAPGAVGRGLAARRSDPDPRRRRGAAPVGCAHRCRDRGRRPRRRVDRAARARGVRRPPVARRRSLLAGRQRRLRRGRRRRVVGRCDHRRAARGRAAPGRRGDRVDRDRRVPPRRGNRAGHHARVRHAHRRCRGPPAGVARVRDVRACSLAGDDDAPTRSAWSHTVLVIGARDRPGCLVDLATAEVRAALPPLLWAIASPEGARILVARAAGGVELRSSPDGAVVSRLGTAPAWTADFSADGRAVAYGGTDGGAVCAAERGDACRSLGAVRSLAFVDGGARLAVLDFDGAVSLVEPASGDRTPVSADALSCDADCRARGAASLDRDGPHQQAVVVDAPARFAFWTFDRVALHDARSGAAIPVDCPTTPGRFELLADGHLLAHGCIVDVATGAVRRHLESGGSLTYPSVDRRAVVVTPPEDDGGFLAIVDAATGADRARIELDGALRVEVVLAGDTFVEHLGAELRVWSVPPRVDPFLRIPTTLPAPFAITADGSHLLYAHGGRAMHVPLTSGGLRDALARATRVCLDAGQRRQLLEENEVTAREREAACRARAAGPWRGAAAVR